MTAGGAELGVNEVRGIRSGRVAVPDGVDYREIDGEAVLLDVESGRYFGLDPAGTRFWRALAECGTVPLACERLLSVYDVEAGPLAADVEAFVETLVGLGLLRFYEAVDGDAECMASRCG